ncbi:porin [Mesorhizobium tianshanense]|uniref:Outer membrane immunogenic protein n=2 Tax=Mesorhizobium tianshanense TaxID=39844 RepID=A0A562PDQ2_9HYPH|nr:outer membrane immunogenic protein [Mesorhizobium tianshanense]GLS38817.1 porin [Mesorhizobium tianshanense]
MKTFLVTASILAASVSLASAADVMAVAEPPAGFVWSGGYVGLQAGYGWGDSDNDFPSSPIAEIDGDIDGGLVGIYGGWNWQFNQVVAGIEADVNYSGIEGTSTNVFDESATTELRWNGAVRGRLGYAFDQFLIYGAGGVAFGDIDVDLFDAGGTFAAASETKAGWTVGVGTDIAFSANLIGRAEYRYTDYGEVEYTAPGGDGSIDVDTHTVAIGLAYKF